MPTATARLSSTTGVGRKSSSRPYSAAICGQSVWSAVAAVAWQAAMAAWIWYGPGRPAPSAASSTETPSPIVSADHKERS
jgi:hypothetical protein